MHLVNIDDDLDQFVAVAVVVAKNKIISKERFQ
jgi:hypothetical protein